MTTAYVVRAIEYVEDVACDIRMLTRDYSVYSGALCEDTSATTPGSEIKLNTVHVVQSSPFHSPEDGEEGGRPKARGMERFVEGVVAKWRRK